MSWYDFTSDQQEAYAGETMLKSISGLIAVTAFIVGFTVFAAQPADAAGCSSSRNTCAARCKKDNPTDKNCVSDHCMPKYNQCKVTGCWQEGGRYGGGLTCNMDRK